MRRDDVLEIIEVKPLTVADVQADRDERAPADPAPRPHPVRA